MKNRVIPIVLVLTLLLTLGAIFVEGNYAPTHAATNLAALEPTMAPTMAPSPTASHQHSLKNIQRVNCTVRVPEVQPGGAVIFVDRDRMDLFRIWTDNGTRQICYANAGTVSVTLYNVNKIFTGNNTGQVTWKNDGKSATFKSLPSKNMYYTLNTNRILSITIY